MNFFNKCIIFYGAFEFFSNPYLYRIKVWILTIVEYNLNYYLINERRQPIKIVFISSCQIDACVALFIQIIS